MPTGHPAGRAARLPGDGLAGHRARLRLRGRVLTAARLRALQERNGEIFNLGSGVQSTLRRGGGRLMSCPAAPQCMGRDDAAPVGQRPLAGRRREAHRLLGWTPAHSLRDGSRRWPRGWRRRGRVCHGLRRPGPTIARDDAGMARAAPVDHRAVARLQRGAHRLGLSIVEIMSALWEGTMKDAGTSAPDRDRFIPPLAMPPRPLRRPAGRLLDDATFATFCGTARSSASTRARPRRRGRLYGLARPGAVHRVRADLRIPPPQSPVARVRAPERRRVQRGPGLGGGLVRRAPPPLEPVRRHRPHRPAGPRPHARRAGHAGHGPDVDGGRMGRLGRERTRSPGAAGRPLRPSRERQATRRHRGYGARQGRVVHGRPAGVALPQPHP